MSALIISLLCVPIMMLVFFVTDSNRFQYIFGFSSEVTPPLFEEEVTGDELSWMYVKNFAQYRIYVELFLTSFRYRVYGVKVIKRRPGPLAAEILATAMCMQVSE